MDTVCQTCGDRGYEEALVHCCSCKIEAIHRYCLGITPVPLTERLTWICEACDREFDFKEVDQTAKRRHILRRSETKKKKKNRKKKKKKNSSNHTPPDLAFEDHGVQDATNVEPLEVHSSAIKEITEESKKLNDSTVVATDGPSVPKAETSSRVPDNNACTTNKRKLRSIDIPLTSDNRQLADGTSPCKEVEPKPQMSAGLTSRHCKAQPIETPTWRGVISVKGGKFSRLDGIVGHVSSLACPKVHETARSLHPQLFAEMFPRLKIWPKSFLKSGGPKNESVALFFFPSSESNDEKVFYSLVLEMKKDDLAMRCVLHDADLLLFSSNMLPTDSWNSKSDGYLWGVFKRR